MVDQQKRQEFIDVYRQGADQWRAKGNLVRESRSLTSLLMNYLALAAVQCRHEEDARLWFAEREVLPVLKRHIDVLHLLVDQVDAGETNATAIAGNYPHLVFVHLAWALGEYELGERLTAIACRPDVLKLSTPFWCEYAAAIDALVGGRVYVAGEHVRKGKAGNWNAYLQLIQYATNSSDLTIAIADVDAAFVRRNGDKKSKDDAYEIEGSGKHPVQWDFRRDGLLRYIYSRR